MPRFTPLARSIKFKRGVERERHPSLAGATTHLDEDRGVLDFVDGLPMARHVANRRQVLIAAPIYSSTSLCKRFGMLRA
jgi:hypothetical protein